MNGRQQEPEPMESLFWRDEPCDRCGGGVDDDHPTTCMPCRYEQHTGRTYERDVDAAQQAGMTFAQYAQRLASPAPPRAPTETDR